MTTNFSDAVLQLRRSISDAIRAAELENNYIINHPEAHWHHSQGFADLCTKENCAGFHPYMKLYNILKDAEQSVHIAYSTTAEKSIGKEVGD